MIIKIVFLTFILLITGCSDPKYRSTINYDLKGDFIIKETKNSMGNIPPYSFYIVKKNNDLKDMTFILSALTRYSDPEIILNLNSAKITFNGINFSALNKENLKMSGTVDPKNGRTTFDKIEINFPYPKDLRWGEKLNFLEDENSFSMFEIIIPATLNNKNENITFTYIRRDIAGEHRFGRFLSF